MTEERKKEWYFKIKEASALWFKENPDYNPAFNYYDSAEIIIPNDLGYYRIPITMWEEYHNELFNVEKINNIFRIDSVIKEETYIKVTGEYQLSMIPECLPFERGDILTEDKYHGHQIYVAFATKDENGKNGLILDTKSKHPNIKKPLKKIIIGLQLFKINEK